MEGNDDEFVIMLELSVKILHKASISIEMMFKLVNCLHHELANNQVNRTDQFTRKEFILNNNTFIN